MPPRIRTLFGHALDIAQQGRLPQTAKPLRGFGGASVLEIVEDHDGDTFRAVYAARFPEAIYVLHVFQKKSKRGIQTPCPDMETIRQRLRAAEILHNMRSEWGGG